MVTRERDHSLFDRKDLDLRLRLARNQTGEGDVDAAVEDVGESAEQELTHRDLHGRMPGGECREYLRQ
jgi:hypothetical protein